jgi:hypothetical protein
MEECIQAGMGQKRARQAVRGDLWTIGYSNLVTGDATDFRGQ